MALQTQRGDQVREVRVSAGFHLRISRLSGQGRLVRFDCEIDIAKGEVGFRSVDVCLSMIEVLAECEIPIQQGKRYTRMPVGKARGLDSQVIALMACSRQ